MLPSIQDRHWQIFGELKSAFCLLKCLNLDAMSNALKNEYAVDHPDGINQEIIELTKKIEKNETLRQDRLKRIKELIKILPEKGVAVYKSRNQPQYGHGELTYEERELDNTFIYLNSDIETLCIICNSEGNMKEQLRYLQETRKNKKLKEKVDAPN